MAELIAQERVAVVNAASVDAKVATPVPPAENKAKDAAKKGVDVKPSFYDQVCSYDGFDSTSDWNQNLDLNAFSLDPLIKQYKAYKKRIQDEVEGWIASQAPDTSRPMALAAVIAKKLKDVLDVIQCATKLIAKVMKLIQTYSQMIIKTMNKIRNYISKLQRQIKALEQDIMNLPNWFIGFVMNALNKDLLKLLNAGDLLKNAMAILREIEKLKAEINGLEGFLQNQIAQIRSAGRRMIDSFIAARKTITSLDWHMQPIQSLLSVLTPEERKLFEEIGHLVDRIDTNVLKQNASGVLEVSVESPIMIQVLIAERLKQMTELMKKTDTEKTQILLIKDKILFQLNKLHSQLTNYVNYTSQLDDMVKTLHSLDVKNQELLVQLEEIAKTDLTIDARSLQYSQQTALTMTMTNDSTKFSSYDGLTNTELMNKLNLAQDNTWIDIFSSNKPGYMIVGGGRFGALELDSDISDPDVSVGIRLLIDNGLWSIEAYSTDKNDADYSVFGKFASVPLAPAIEMTRTITFEEFMRAINNPIATEPSDHYVIVGNPVITSEEDYYLNSYQRYLTQVEINEMEQAYIEALIAFNLSPVYVKSSHTIHSGVNRILSLDPDTRLSDKLLGSKPYSGMKIPVKSLMLQMTKINIGDSIATTLDSNYPFGIQCDWGFLSEF